MNSVQILLNSLFQKGQTLGSTSLHYASRDGCVYLELNVYRFSNNKNTKQSIYMYLE